MNTLHLLATCARGFEPCLERELKSLACNGLKATNGGVIFEADFEQAMKVCLWSRIANKIEVLIKEDYVTRESDLYDLGKKIPLEPWFSPEATFCIHAHVNDEKLGKCSFLALKFKDGIVDQMRDKWGRRASVDTERPDVVVGLQIIQRKARVFIELQGDPLNMRGYRRRQIQAPIRETLAASMIALSGWQPQNGIFIDPMCGSGTFAIEAALIATQTAPGIQRHFGFEKLPFFPEKANTWRILRDEAREISKKTRKNFNAEIRAVDIDSAALDIALNNAQTAGVADLIQFTRGDILNMKPISQATLVTNPPYGERITVDDLDLPEFYYQLGRLVRTFANSSLTIISTAELLKKNMHMKPSQRVATYNGPIACEVATYQLGISR